MSAETKAALDAAIQAHYGDLTDGGFVSAYVLQIVGATMEDYETGNYRYLRTVSSHQAPHVTSGLLNYAKDDLRASTRRGD